MKITTFDELLELLKNENVPFRAHKDSQLVEIGIRSGPLETEMVIRWEIQLVLAQFIVAFPYKIPTERITKIEHALALVNHRLIMPGFSIDPENRLLYYRLVVPRAEDGSLSTDYIQRLTETAIDTMIDFLGMFTAIVQEDKDPEPLLAELAPKLALPKNPNPQAPANPSASAGASAEASAEASAGQGTGGSGSSEPPLTN